MAEVTTPIGQVSTYASLKEAIAAVETTAFSTQAAPEKPTVVKLLADTNDGIDIGTSGKLLQNVELDLNGKTLTLGPGIGSANTETNGIRVLSYSKLAVKNGTVVCSTTPYTTPQGVETYVKIGFANYGTLALDNVQVKSSEHVEYTINNRGALTLSGATSVESGGAAGCVAITNDVYNAHYADFDASLTVADPQVTVGKVLVERYAANRNGNAGGVVLAISAGTFDSIVDDSSLDVPLVSNVTGGTFASPPMSYVAPGYMIFQNDSGSFYVDKAKDAEVNGASYPTLLDALEAAPDGATIKLLQSVTIDASKLANPFYYEVSGKSITLDLADCAITLDETDLTINASDRAGTERGLFDVAADGGLIVKDSNGKSGTITAKAPATGYTTRPLIDVHGTFELSGGTVKGVENLYYLMGVNGPDAHMTISGGTLDNQWGTPKDGGACLSSNGNAGNEGFTLDITGGTLKGGEQTLYLPSAGTTTISGDAVLEGTARAVEIRSGELNIAGGTFTAAAERIDGAVANNGATGAYTGAIVVSNPASASATGYVGDVNVDITGGTFVNASGDALVVVNEQKSDANPYYQVNMSVSGGEFQGGFNVSLPSTSEEKLAISGGSFSVDPTQYVSYGFEVAESDGVYVVNAIQAVAATVDGVETVYPSVWQALEAASDKGEVSLKLLKDIEEDVLVPEGVSVTLDLAGYKLTSVKHHAITNAGTLVVTDSSAEQTGQVDGTMNGRAALLNLNTGKATIEGGTFTRSAEKGADGSANGNSWYTVKNEGDLIVSGGTIVNTSSYSSLVRNDGTMLVEGGTLQQDGIIAVNNYSTGEFSMTGGTIVSKDDQGIINWNKAAVTGGAIEAKIAVTSYSDSSDTGAAVIGGEAVVAGDVHTIAYTNAVGVPSVSIEGGTVDGTLQKQTYDKSTKKYIDVEADDASSKLVASGGTFFKDPTAFVAEGYEAAKNVEGRYVVQKQGNQAAVNGTEYATLAEAIAAAKSGDTVKVIKNINLGGETINVAADDEVVLDLNGFSITGTGNPLVLNRGTLVIRDSGSEDVGSIVNTESGKDAVAAVGSSASLTIESGQIKGENRAVVAQNGATMSVTGGKLMGKAGLRASNGAADVKTSVSVSNCEIIGTTWGMYIQGNIDADEAAHAVAYPVEVTVGRGASISSEGETGITVRGNGAVLNVQDGTVAGGPGYGAIDGNGTPKYGGTVINIHGGTVTGVTDRNADGSFVESGVGIYHPQAGTLNITGGAITGDTGIEMRAGTLNVEGGTITGTMTPTEVNPNGSGSTSDGVGIAVAQHSTKLPIDVNVSGGIISGYSAFYESNPEKNSADDIARVNIALTGGKFKAIDEGTVSVYSEDKTGFVSGGLFGTEIDAAYVADGDARELVENADPATMDEYPYTIGDIVRAQIGTGDDAVTYPTLEAAFGAVQAGQTITVVKDTAMGKAATLDVEGDVTLDLAGHTVTVSSLGDVATAAFLNKGYAANLSIVSSAEGGAIDYRAGKGEVVKTYGNLTLGKDVSLIGNGSGNSVSALGADVVVDGASVTGGYCAIGLFNRAYDNTGTQEENPSAHLVVNQGSVLKGTFAVSTNNLKSAGCTATINGGTLETPYTGIYWAAEGTVTVNGGTISGQTGIEMKMGDLVVNGGTVSTVDNGKGGADGLPDKPGSGGSTESGSGIYLAGKFYGAAPSQSRESTRLTATINGGAITSLHGDAIAVYEGDKAVPFAPTLTVPAGADVALSAASGKQQVAYYHADVVKTPAARISALGIEGVTKHALTYAGVDGWANPNPTEITAYDIVAIANPTLADKTFSGWTVGTGGVNKGDAFNVVLQGVSGDVTLTAVGKAVEGAADVPPISNEPVQEEGKAETGVPADQADAVKDSAAKTATDLVSKITETSEATGVSTEDAAKVQEVVETAGEDSTIVSTIAVAAEPKAEAEVANEDKDVIKAVVADSQTIAQYLDLTVKMTVEEKPATGQVTNKAEIPLTQVEEPIPFVVKVAPSTLKNEDGSLKGVVVVAAHEGKPLVITPSVDYEKGAISFYADQFSTYSVVLSATTARTPTVETIDGVEMLFANGTPVTIEAGSDADHVKVSWGGAEGQSKEIASSGSVFGGSHNNSSTLETTNVTLKSGSIRNVLGGGLHASDVKVANVFVEGGTAVSVMGGGAAWLKDDGCGTAVAGSYPADKAKINNKVGTAKVTVSGGTVTTTVFGGGESISSVGAANVAISGGDLSGAWVTAGGSNGYTGSASLAVSGGKINVVQGVNRGTTDDVSMNMTGGTIANLYLGGEAGDASVTGTISTNVLLTVGTEASIEKLAAGTSGGTDLAAQEGIAAATVIDNPTSVGNLTEFAKSVAGKVSVDAAIDLSTATVTWDVVADQPYAGKSIKPTPSISVNGVVLDPSFYELTYDANVLPGTATITARGLDYAEGKLFVKGSATTTFKIKAADKAALTTKLDAAKKLRDATTASSNGLDVVVGSWWAPSSAINTFGQAILKADYANVQTYITQTDVNAAVSALTSATSAFNSARKQVATLDKKTLVSNLSAAKQLCDATATSANGSDIAVGSWWVTPLAMSAYQQAISAADQVNAQAKTTQAAVNTAVSDLAKAISTFQTARKQGTKQNVVVVSGTAKRLAGDVATGTAQAISAEGFSKSSTVVLARNDGFHDAMSATGLAGAYNCPILLTDTNSLSSETASEIKRLGATKVFIIGGTAAISTAVENQVKALGASIERLAGSDAPDTSVKCAAAIVAKTGASSNAIIATSDTFQDALSVSTFANKYKVPILLLDGDKQVISGAKKYLDAASKIYVPGGTAAVPNSATNPYGSKIVRFAGSDAMDTSNKVAEYLVSNKLLTDSVIGVANGLVANGVDALAGSALMGQKGGVMLLTDGTNGGGATIDQFLKSHGKNVSKAYVFGGTAVVSPALYNKVGAFIK